MMSVTKRNLATRKGRNSKDYALVALTNFKLTPRSGLLAVNLGNNAIQHH
jgi:hypothetical protein